MQTPIWFRTQSQAQNQTQTRTRIPIPVQAQNQNQAPTQTQTQDAHSDFASDSDPASDSDSRRALGRKCGFRLRPGLRLGTQTRETRSNTHVPRPPPADPSTIGSHKFNTNIRWTCYPRPGREMRQDKRSTSSQARDAGQLSLAELVSREAFASGTGS